jgi:2,4-dienoyl-CoA reductase-like NADH-dependent reductase (Old Yellow Enzyme family)/thioredoxin reductase
MANVNFDHLFSPLQVGPMKVPNRICETTNTINSSMAPGLIDEHFIAHHGAKAKGGTGWIGSETWLLNAPFPEGAPPEIGLAVGFGTPWASYQNPVFLEGKKKFCEEIHKTGAVVVVQLTHLSAVWAPSAVPVIGAQDYTPHVLGEAEIEAHLNIYADAAEAALNCGADGVEIHCAHETLVYSFLSPVTNRRTDQWGGEPSSRIRFAVEALKRVRARVGNKMAVGIRMAGMEFREGGYDNLQMREMLYLIADTGLLDFVDLDVGHCWGAPSYVPNSYYAHGQFRDVGKGARVDLDPKIKVLFTGRINDPVVAEELLKGGCCDLVGMVRAGIADPEFAIKAKEGRLDEIRRCIACTRCIDEASEPATFPYTPTCSINPVIGSELRWEEQFKPAAQKKNVVVVGGGLAGCEAARIAAKRGHKVTLLEQNKRLGGQLLISSKVAGRDSFEDQIYFEENEMIRSGVTVKLEAAADIAAIKALNPDAVVIATGSVPRVPHDVEGLNQAHVVQGWDVMQGKAQTGKRVAVISQEDYYETPCVAEFLAAQGKEVTVFHKSVHLGSEIARYSIGMVHKRMEEFNVTVKTNLVLTKVDGKAIELASAWGGKSYREEGFDSVVLVYASTAKCELYDQLKADGSVKQLYLAGAAWLPRHMAESTRHGANIGLSI